MSLIVRQFLTIWSIQMSLTFGLFTQVRDSRPHGPHVFLFCLKFLLGTDRETVCQNENIPHNPVKAKVKNKERFL